MVPLRSLVEVRLVLGPQSLNRYNNLRSVTINGQAGAGAEFRRGAGRDGAGLGGGAAGVVHVRVDRDGVAGEGGGRADRR